MSLDPVDALILAALPFRPRLNQRSHPPSQKQSALETALTAIFTERAKARGRTIAPSTAAAIDREGALLAFSTALETCRSAGMSNVDLVEAINAWFDGHPAPIAVPAA